MTLGLDLQGGSHILLQMDQNDLIKDRLETTRDEIRTLLRDAKIGYTGLAGIGQDRAGPHHRSRPGRCRQDGAEDADRSGRRRPVHRRLHPGNVAGRFRTRPAQVHRHRRRHQIPHVDGADAVDRGRRAPRQRTRHDRADRAAAGRRPHPRPGAGSAGSATAEGNPRPDRQADLPDGRPVDAGAGRAQRPSAGRLVGAVFAGRSAGSVSDREPRHRFGRKPRRCAGDVQFAEQRAGGFVPLQFEGARHASARRPRRMSASCSPSSSTIR